MRSRYRILLGALVVLAGTITLAALLREDDDSLERVRAAGVLRIGYAIEAPYALLDVDGRVTGESPETARRIASRLGVPRTEWVQSRFESLIPDLREGRIDVAAAGLFITPERKRLVRFSDPTVLVAPGLLVRRGNPQRLPTFAQLRPTSSVRIAVLAGSVEEQRLRRRGWDAGLLVVPEAQAARAALAQGVVDALALSTPTLRWIAKSSQSGVYEVIEDDLRDWRDADRVGFAFSPKDAALQQAWNRAQSGFIGSREHLLTIAPFGFTAANLAPGERTSEVPSQ